MKKTFFVALACLVVGLFVGWLIFGRSSTIVGTVSADNSQKKILYYKDPMHPWYTSEKPGKAPDCGMDLVPVYEGETAVKGVKIDPVVVQNIGVKIEEVRRRSLSKTIRAVGKITYNETKLYNVNTKVMGWVENLYVDYTGKVVRKGDPLLEIYSPELVNTQEEYLLALRYQSQLKLSNVEEARRGADDLVASARRRLLYWDISPKEIQEIEDLGVPKKVMTIYSPADGVVLEKMVVNGQNIMAGMTLYKIADLSDVWVLADIYQYELDWVKLGQQAEVELSYLPGRVFKGRITYIYPFLAEETRTAKVRIEVANPKDEFLLKPDMFATVKIKSPQVLNAVAVPEQAIIRSGERNVVVVSLGGGYFDPRDVKLGSLTQGYAVVLEGLREGEKIVTSSQFLIDSESNLKTALALMRGHAGHDISRPRKEDQRSPEEQIAPEVKHKHSDLDHDSHDMPKAGEKIEKRPKVEPGSAVKSGKKPERIDRKKKEDTRKVKVEEKELYTCVMHPDVVSDKPGDCPKCGMKLVPKSSS